MDDAIFDKYRQTGRQVVACALYRHGNDLRTYGGQVATSRIEVDERLTAESGRKQVREAFPEKWEGGGGPRKSRKEHCHRRHHQKKNENCFAARDERAPSGAEEDAVGDEDEQKHQHVPEISALREVENGGHDKGDVHSNSNVEHTVR